jgi:ABC-type proline/glycine betaine transport system permease subunit
VSAISATLRTAPVRRWRIGRERRQPFFRIDWIIDNADVLAQATVEHIALTLIAVVGGVLIAFPVTIVIQRRRRLIGPVLGFTGILYAIPSLALFAVLIPFTGIGLLTAEIADQLHAADPRRNGVAGLDGVGPRSWRPDRVGLPRAALASRIPWPRR